MIPPRGPLIKCGVWLPDKLSRTRSNLDFLSAMSG
jgi:hypothetical protein